MSQNFTENYKKCLQNSFRQLNVHVTDFCECFFRKCHDFTCHEFLPSLHEVQYYQVSTKNTRYRTKSSDFALTSTETYIQNQLQSFQLETGFKLRI